MKLYLFTLTLFCFSITCFSQNKSLFSKEKEPFDYSIKKNDSSLLYKQLFSDKSLAGNSFLLPDIEQTERRRSFLESENSATKNVMPAYKPKGNFKQKSIFPDDTMKHFLLIEPVKER